MELFMQSSDLKPQGKRPLSIPDVELMIIFNWITE